MSSGSSSSSTSPTQPAGPHRNMASVSSQPPLRPAASMLPTTPRPLLLTVRFTASVADLQLDIPRPGTTTVVALKHLIRGRLEAPNDARRLRFIHGGKILPDTAVLSDVLRVPPPPPPPPPSAHGPAGKGKASESAGSGALRTADDPKGKGKAVEGQAAPQRIYVNCSIGDVLSEAELAAEQRLAERRVAGPTSNSPSAGGDAGNGVQGGAQTNASAGGVRTTAAGRQGDRRGMTRTPRGFDRLLTAGFTTAEVNQLRLQFRSIHAARHTPDTMPSPDTLRSMEDAWIDNNNNAGLGAANGAGEDGSDDFGTGGGVADADAFGGISGLLDVLLRGMTIGFLWPLGSCGWLIREEGIWSRRWQVFVSLGCILSLTIGTIRVISGEK